MPYYVKFTNQGNFGLEVQGLTGGLNVEYELFEDAPLYDSPRYLIDGRRAIGSDVRIGGKALVQNSISSTFDFNGGVSNQKINGVSSSSLDLFEASTGDVCSFDYIDGITSATDGCIMLGRNAENQDSFNGLAIANLKITDDNGIHTFTFTASDNIITSDTGDLTLTMYNAPGDDSHLVFYSEDFETGKNVLSYSLTSSLRYALSY